MFEVKPEIHQSQKPNATERRKKPREQRNKILLIRVSKKTRHWKTLDEEGNNDIHKIFSISWHRQGKVTKTKTHVHTHTHTHTRLGGSEPRLGGRRETGRKSDGRTDRQKNRQTETERETERPTENEG